MIVRYLPLILVLTTLVLALAPLEGAARVQTTPAADPASKAMPADRQARPRAAGAPINSDSSQKPIPPGADAREVRPAEAFPPERFERTPPAPSREGVDAPSIRAKDDPRSVEERKDPGD